MVHHLQQQVEQVRVRLLDLVEQQHRVRGLVDGVGEQAALIEPDVAGRRADEARHRVPLHVLRHVEAQELHAQRLGQLLGELRLADARRPGEEEGADGPLRQAEPRAVHLDRLRDPLDRRVLAVDLGLELAFEVREPLAIVGLHPLRGGMRAMVASTASMSLLRTRRLTPLTLALLELGRRARLVDEVDGLVGQPPVVEVARRQLGRRAQRLVGVGDAVELLVLGAQAREHLDRLVDRRLLDLDGLEPPGQRPVLLDVAAVLLVRRGADAAELAVGQRRLDEVRGVHRPARRRARAHDGVQLVDEDDGVLLLAERLHHRLEALLEVAAVARAGHHRPHVERVDGRARQRRRRLAELDAPGQPLDDGRLADARVAHEQRVVLAAPRQHVQRPLDLRRAPDERIDLARPRALVQVDRELPPADRPAPRRASSSGSGLRLALSRRRRSSWPARAWRSRARCS